MKNITKKALSLALSVAILLTIGTALSVRTVLAKDDTSTGPIVTAEKTAEWTNTAKTTANIYVQAKQDDLNAKPKNVLLFGSLCNGHGMGSTTLKETINTIAQKMNVRYYAICSTYQKYTEDNAKLYSGTLKKGESLTTDFTIKKPRHCAAKYFIDKMYDELVVNKNTYDFLLMEYDSSRIVLDLVDELSTTEQAELTTKMDALAPVLADYYTNHKVVWVTDSNKDYSFSKAAPSNRADTGGSIFGIEKFEFKALTCLVSPTEYAAFDTTYASYSTSKTYKLKDIDSYESDIAFESKINYDSVSDLAAFIKKRMLSQRSIVTFKDTVVSDMEITGASVQTSSDGTTWTNHTVTSPSTLTISADKKTVTADIRDIIFEVGTVEYARLKISVKDLGLYKVTTDPTVKQRDPNNGPANVTVTPYGFQKTELKPTTTLPLKWDDQAIYTLTTTVVGGTTPQAVYYAAVGESPVSETAPNGPTFQLAYVKVNGTRLSGTALNNYKSTHKYTATNISADTTVDVCYGEAVKGTYLPVKKNETPTTPVSDDMLTNTQIQVILNDGVWTKPDTLTATATPTVYTIAGDYNMGTPTKSGYVFLGWDVKDGTGDIEKVYTAIFEKDEIGDITSEPGKDKPDGIPDKYQRLITFKVVNGTWDGVATNNADKKQYITLKDKDGNWSVDGTATVTAPSGMVANYGYEKGSWGTTNPVIPSTNVMTLTKSTNVVFTHTFSAIPDKKVTFKVPDSQTPVETEIPYGKKIKIDPNGGTVTVDTEHTTAFERVMEADFVIPDAVAMTGYKFTGWKETAGTGDIVKVYTAQYEALPVESRYLPPQTEDKKPDEVVDKENVKYDDKIKVILNDGTWTKPDTLTATATPMVYTVKGDYNMGTPTKSGYVFVGWDVKDGTGDIVKIYTALFEKDEIGDITSEPGKDKPDGIPDKYQRLITFKVVNGTWDGVATNNADKKQYITLKDATGKWSVDGTAAVTAPSGMKANYGYENGSWGTTNPVIPSTNAMTLTKDTDVVFTYAFTAIPDKNVTFKIPDNQTPGSTPIPYGKKIKIDPNGGKVTVDTEHTTAFERVIEADFAIPDATPMTGYEFTGWNETAGTGDIVKVYTAQYKALPVETRYQPPQDEDKKPDEIVDDENVKYDDKVQVILNNGTWTKPENLIATTTATVYTVKGDYNMGLPTKDGYVFLGWDVQDGSGDIVKIYTALFEEDKGGDLEDPNEDKPDGVPDKYQRLITFKVVNGTWDGVATNNADKKQYITLKDAAGKWSVDGTATVTAPSGMVANEGYEKGSWGTTNPVIPGTNVMTLTKSTDLVFTYTYTLIINDVKYKTPDDKKPDGDTPLPYGAIVVINPNGGSVTMDEEIKTETFSKVVKENLLIPDAVPMEGYKFVGWVEVAGVGSVTKVYTAAYEANAVESRYQPEQDGKNPPEVIENTTKYDDLVKVVLNGGTWVGAPAALVKTDVDGVYVVKGDYFMSYAKLEGYDFLGWEVQEGTDGIAKVYTAKFRIQPPKTGEDMSAINACFVALLVSFLAMVVATLLRKKKSVREK